MLQRAFDVEVLGFSFESGKGDPRSPRDFPYTAIPVPPSRSWVDAERELRARITGDLLYAMKPRPSSFGVALRHRASSGLPVVVDIDDWELFMIHPWSRYTLKNMAYALARLDYPNHYLATWALDKRIRSADGVTVVSSFLQARYGGALTPQYVDIDTFDPVVQPREDLRSQLRCEGQHVIVFAGIAQPGKGVGEIIQALQLLDDSMQNWQLLIVGPQTPYARAVAQCDERVRLIGMYPPSATPQFLAIADLIVLPQQPVPVALGQMPMKLYEAMAMGLPIVATAVSDIPELLDGCGLVVPPGDRPALARAIESVLCNPALARRLGRAARARITTHYSCDIGADELRAYFTSVARLMPHRKSGAGLTPLSASCT
jgi:glycosyltransferase involved in cell wall biosynthesis